MFVQSAVSIIEAVARSTVATAGDGHTPVFTGVQVHAVRAYAGMVGHGEVEADHSHRTGVIITFGGDW